MAFEWLQRKVNMAYPSYYLSKYHRNPPRMEKEMSWKQKPFLCKIGLHQWHDRCGARLGFCPNCRAREETCSDPPLHRWEMICFVALILTMIAIVWVGLVKV